MKFLHWGLHWGWVSFAIALSACSLNQAANGTAPATNASESAIPIAKEEVSPSSCTPMDSQVPLQPATDIELPFERFNFRPTSVSETDDTITFAGSRYSFTFCKRDRTWGIETIAPVTQTEEDYAEYYEALGDPDYSPITASDGQPYEARVRLDASWLKDSGSTENDLEEVVFELIKLGDTEPSSTVLYSNTDIIERNLGASAGVPTITRTLVTENALWWAIGFEQGEGASGISTVVQYEIDTEQVQVWQPNDLGSAQINDLAITGPNNAPTLWLGTQYSGEGNPYIPAKGLVAYQPANDTTQTYTVENSPLTGAIPTRLHISDQALWVATGNGVCAIDWTTIETTDSSWNCWNFITMADVASGQELYGSLLAEQSIGQLETSEPVEILWLADQDISTSEDSLRYEISYQPGITTQLSQGADYYVGPEGNLDDGYFWWPGQDWSWNGERFVRPWDQVAVNYVGGGPSGIGEQSENYIANWQAMRGEFELLEITEDNTEIKYYSAWINADDIEPIVTVRKAANVTLGQANPTDAILAELKQKATQ